MNIISYRGPGMAGGVSAALARAWDTSGATSSSWWHLHSNILQVSDNANWQPTPMATLPQSLIEGHYRYCNDFLWPVMHDLPQYATYTPGDRRMYDLFNDTLGWCIARSTVDHSPQNYFVQDYQLANLPRYLKEVAGADSVVFWHIPWPRHVDSVFVEPILSLVRSLLHSQGIGFHTQEYAENFLTFVEKHMPNYVIDWQSMEAIEKTSVVSISRSRIANSRRTFHMPVSGQGRSTKALVAPLGIDFEHWHTLAQRQTNTILHPTLMSHPFILSVDRADYTKGVTNRIAAIDHFFEKCPQWREKVVFAQICGKTRTGLQAFDGYWQQTKQMSEALKEKWATPSWQPLVWIEKSFSSEELSLLYAEAEMMLVNPVRDGLNLTAKEYVACQGRRPGALALSTGAGAWSELGSHAISVDPHCAQHIAASVQQCLAMSADEKSWRMVNLKEQVRKNSLGGWWNSFADLLVDRGSSTATHALKESS